MSGQFLALNFAMAQNMESFYIDDQRSPVSLCLSYCEGEDSFQRKKDVETVVRTPIPPKTPVKFSPWFRMELERKASLVTFRTDKTKSLPLSVLYNHHHPDIYMNQVFKDVTLVGEGHYGKVYKAVSREDGKVYAIKVSKEIFHNESEKLKRFEEVRKHEMVPVHPNCVRLYNAWEEKAKLYLWLEFCDISLESYAAKNHDIKEWRVWEILLDLLLGLKNLHDNNLIHVDVKLDNILMTTDGVCKLADFGLLIDTSQGELRLKHAIEGDGRYLAPELLKGGPFSAAADVFSLGLCILELAADIVMPGGGEDWQMLRRGEIPLQKTLHLSEELRSVITRMLTPDYLQRPTVNVLLTQPRLQRMWLERINRNPLSINSPISRLPMIRIMTVAGFLTMLLFVLVKMAEKVGRKVRRQASRALANPVAVAPVSSSPAGCMLRNPNPNPNSRLFNRSLRSPRSPRSPLAKRYFAANASPLTTKSIMHLSDEELEVTNGIAGSALSALASSTPCKPSASAPKKWPSALRRGLYDSVISQRTLDFSKNESDSAEAEAETEGSPQSSPSRWSSITSAFSSLNSESVVACLEESRCASPLNTTQNSSRVGTTTTPQLTSPLPRKPLSQSHLLPMAGRNLFESFNSSDEEMTDGERAKMRKKRERKKR